MKTLIQNYVFDPPNRQVTLLDIPTVELEQLLLIINKSTPNVMIYNFADPSLSCTVSGNVLTLTYDTTAMNSIDSLQIYVDVPIPSNVNELYPLDEQYTYDINMERVLGSQSLTEDNRLKVTSVSKDIRKNGVLANTNQYLELDCSGYCTASIQTSGTWTGTIYVEGMIDGSTNYKPIALLNTYGVSPLNWQLGSFNANDLFRASIVGMIKLRVRFSSYANGQATVVIVASPTPYVVPIATNSAGSLNTTDAYLSSSYKKGLNDASYQELSVAPTVNPNQPGSYTDNKYARIPQRLQMIRVLTSGSEQLPFAQEPFTNKLLVANDDERRLLEEILTQLQLLNQNFALANGLNIPLQSEIR